MDDDAYKDAFYDLTCENVLDMTFFELLGLILKYEYKKTVLIIFIKGFLNWNLKEKMQECALNIKLTEPDENIFFI